MSRPSCQVTAMARGLERAHGQALVGDRAVEHDLAALEQLVTGVPEGHLESDVGAVLREEEHLALLGLDGVDHRVEGLVVDDDELRRVLRDLLALGDDHGHHLADEANGVAGDVRPGQAVGDHARDGHGERRQVVGGRGVRRRVDGDHTGDLAGLGDIDLGEGGVRHRRPHEVHVDRAVDQRILQVGGVPVRPCQEGGVLTSLDPGAHHAHLCHSPRRSKPRPRRRTGAGYRTGVGRLSARGWSRGR